MNSQSVFRIDDLTNRAYTKISNELLQDSRISHETKGLICELLSRPLDWEITVIGLVNSGPSGRDKVYRMIREAKQYNYIIEGDKASKGRANRQQYIVTDDPETLQMRYEKIAQKIQKTIEKKRTLPENTEVKESPEKLTLPEKPEVKNTLPENTEVLNCEVIEKVEQKTLPEKTDPLNPTQTNKRYNKGNIYNNIYNNNIYNTHGHKSEICDSDNKKSKRSKIDYSERFEIFWSAYVKCCKKMASAENEKGSAPGTKKEAFIEWKILSSENHGKAEQALRAYVLDCKQSGQSMKHCCRYLKFQVWEAYEVSSKDLSRYAPETLEAVASHYLETGELQAGITADNLAKHLPEQLRAEVLKKSGGCDALLV